MQIPLVDFGPFLNENIRDKQAVSQELVKCFKECGFVYLKNFGIANQTIEEMFQFSREFFNKPIEYKCLLKKPKLESIYGYDVFEAEHTAFDRPGDLKESYMVRCHGAEWPKDWIEFETFMNSFHQQCYLLAVEIFRAFGIGLNLRGDYFVERFSSLFLRLLHYPRLPDKIEARQIRCGEHTDYGALTLLFQDSTGGLEIKAKNGSWISAPHIPNTLLVNIGDAMEIWTNGLLKANLHRVMNPIDETKNQSRYSTVIFCDPDLNAAIGCLDDFISSYNPARYDNVIYKDHLFAKYNKTYKKHAET